jgi:hypothetical protein
VHRPKSTGGIILISKTIVLRQTDARSIKGKPLDSSKTSGPTGVMGDSAFFVKRIFGTEVKPCQKLLDCLHIKSPHLRRKRRQPERDGEAATRGYYPPLMCTMIELLHHNIAIKRFTNLCFFYYLQVGINSAFDLCLSHALLNPVCSSPKATGPTGRDQKNKKAG